MDPTLYKAAETGNWDVIQRYVHLLDNQLNPNKDTALHVLSRSCDSYFVVQQILGRNPKLIRNFNADRETPLHIAARKGHSDIVRAIIDCIKVHREYRPVFRSQNRDGNTALHEAIKNNRRVIIELIVEEDLTLVYIKNGFLRSPLYLAAENGDAGLVERFLASVKEKNDRGTILNNIPRDVRFFIKNGLFKYMTQWDKRNALHAAAIGNFPECVKLILRDLPHLAQETDAFGWMAIHYAARLNHLEVVREMLLSDSFFGENKALSIAVMWGHVPVIDELLTLRPGCWSAVTPSRKNVIHLAVRKEQQQVLDLILKKSWASELVNGRDKSGNTPLHFYVATKRLFGFELVNHPAVERNAFNQDGFTPLDSLRFAIHEDKKRKDFLRSELEKSGATERRLIVSRGADSETPDPEKLKKLGETYQIVATLIVGITFAAGFTIPGGYESNDGPRKGQPVFLSNAGFIVFIIFDFAALSLSLLALISLLLHLHIKERTFQLINIAHCGIAIILSLGALFVSFVTGLYITLPNLGIRISLITVTCGFMIIYVISTISWGLGKRKVLPWELKAMRIMKVIRSS